MAIQKFIVSNDTSVYEAFPDVVQTDSGKLICVFTECGVSHECRDGSRLVTVESTDRGRTWSEKKPLTERMMHGQSFDCARISKLNDGTLTIICNKLHLEDESSNLWGNDYLYMWHGDAEGTDWGEPIILPFGGRCPDKVTQLKNGRLIVSAQQIRERGEEFWSVMWEQFLWYSDDNGKTWSDKITVGSSKEYSLCEGSIIEYGDGILICFMREETFQGLPIMKTISRDNGESWEPVHKSGLDGGHRPIAGFLQSGDVMVTYRFIPYMTQNFFAGILQRDGLLNTGRRNQRQRILSLDYDRHPSPDLGYSGWTQFEDGEIYVVNYIRDDYDKAHIRGYSFWPEDIELPMSAYEDGAAVKKTQVCAQVKED